MKRNLLVCGMLALGVVLSCARAEQPEMEEPEVEVVFRATTEEPDSKTVIQDTYHVYWSPGDEISLFYGNGSNGGNRFTARNSEPVAETEFSGSISTGSAGQYFWGVYPYDASNACDGSSVTLNVPDSQMAVSQSFAPGSFPSVARSDTKTLAFKNVCGGLCFTVRRRGITSVTFSATGNQAIAGTVKVGFGSDGKPAVVNVVNGKSTVTLTAPNGTSLEPGVQYYLSMLPAELSSGFTMSFETDDQRTGTFTSSRKQVIKRSVFGNIPEADANVSSWEGGAPTEGGGTESGFYLGIVGFNQQLYTCPIGRLDYSTLATFESFIDGLTSKSGTLLYYSVSESLGKLQNAQYPDDLASASLVTFTDGIDQGSSMMIDNYPGDAEYLEYLNNRLGYSSVAGQSLSAYSVGFKGSDVSNTSLFSQNLQQLAVPSTNAYEVSSMSAMNSCLQVLAEQLGQKVNSYDLGVTFPGLANGTRVRFTLDDVSSAAASKMYIEGTFNLSNRSLTDVSYFGLTTNMGATVSGVQDGIFVHFDFKNLILEAVPSVSADKIQQWNDSSSSGNWQKNTELEPSITPSRKSTVVLLNLDCSSSLSSQFSTLQGYIKSFVRKLCSASHDPQEVSSVSLNKTTLSLFRGESETLVATVLPSTAANKAVTWSSDNESVAEVSQDGLVTAVGVGRATVTVTTKDRGLTASCVVTIGQLVESITLDKEEIEMYVGDNPVALVATVLPEDATDKSLTWTSSNASVAKVDNQGNVTAVSNGTATITAKANDGSGVTATCSVSVYTHVESVSLNQEEITMYRGGRMNLDATVFPATASNKTVVWSSSDETIATVSQEGLVEAINLGYATITVTTNDGDKTSTCSVTVSEPTAVDLGLSVKWATCNVGANSPEEYGDYFAWGETEPKSKYDWSTYKWCNGSKTTLTRYNTKSDYGTVDNKTEFAHYGYADDAARANWGGSWRTPTYAEWDELIDNCSWTWQTNYNGTGINGYLVTSYKSGYTNKSIFLPAAGYRYVSYLYDAGSYGDYLSSSLDRSFPDLARYVHFYSRGEGGCGYSRDRGRSVRAVIGDPLFVSSVELDQTELTLTEGSTARLTATVKPATATNKSVTWSTSDSSVASVAFGLVTAKKAGTATIKVTTKDGDYTATCLVTVVHPAAVDLGLSVKWATCNVGANSPEEYGDYFAWGETEPKSDYSWSTYIWCNGSRTTLTRYNTKSDYGTVDNKTEFADYGYADDAARANRGGSWRTPTDAEWEELRTSCTWTWQKNYNGTGKKGYLITSNKSGYTNKSIFLPAAGYRDNADLNYAGSLGYYWSSSLLTDYPYGAWGIYFYSDFVRRYNNVRYHGLSVRPVTE